MNRRRFTRIITTTGSNNNNYNLMKKINHNHVTKQRQLKSLKLLFEKMFASNAPSFLLITCLLILIGYCVTDQSSSLSQHQQQQQHQLQQQRQISNNQQDQQQQQAANKIDWPNISIKNITNELAELSTDWLMLGGDAPRVSQRRSTASASSSPIADGDLMVANEGKQMVSIDSSDSSKKLSKKSTSGRNRKLRKQSNRTLSDQAAQFDEEQSGEESESNEIYDDIEEVRLAGTAKEPECASHGRYYCTYKEDYPTKLVVEVTKYYKWPLEKLFRDLHAQIMPKLAQDSNGNLVCDSITRVVRPGWARNTNDRWLVVINTDNYHQYVTEVVCQYGSNSRCNFIPPCYYSSCQQRYNTQKLLVIDPTNPYRGPFLSEFLFPSCCVCYVPTSSDSLQDKYRSSPASIYQRTMQQEASMNLNPMQAYGPTILHQSSSAGVGVGGSEQQVDQQIDGRPSNQQFSNVDQSSSSSSIQNARSLVQQQTSTGKQQLGGVGSGSVGQPLGPGEIRRFGDQLQSSASSRSMSSSLASGTALKSHHSHSSFPVVDMANIVDLQTTSGSSADNIKNK